MTSVEQVVLQYGPQQMCIHSAKGMRHRPPGSDWSHLKCILDASWRHSYFTPVFRAVHLWWDHSGQMVIPGLNRTQRHILDSFCGLLLHGKKKNLLLLYYNFIVRKRWYWVMPISSTAITSTIQDHEFFILAPRVSLTLAGHSWHTWGEPLCCSAGGTCSHRSDSGNPGTAAFCRSHRRPVWRRSSSPVSQTHRHMHTHNQNKVRLSNMIRVLSHQMHMLLESFCEILSNSTHKVVCGERHILQHFYM